jgi:acetyltransferase-like isoleucine patch superfamily enzyme
MIKIKNKVQKLLAYFLSEPIILKSKEVGFSLVRSQRYKCDISPKAKLYAPYYLNNVKLGDYSYISKNSNLTNTTIGKFCSIGPNFNSGLGLHPTNGISTSPMFYSTLKQNGFSLVNKNAFEETKPITIGNDVYIGANVTILDGIRIADGAVIGAGAIVTKDIPPYAISVGIPAKVFKYRFNDETIDKLLKRQWWNFPEADLQKIERSFFDIEKFINE